MARETKTTLSPDTKITTEVGIGPNDKGEGFKLDIDLTVSGTGLNMDEAQDILEHAHRVCPYSNATRGKCGCAVEGGALKELQGEPTLFRLPQACPGGPSR